MNSSKPNPLYEKGYKGYTMISKDGTGTTVPYDRVGALARELHKVLLPLHDGPFGGPNQPLAKSLSRIQLQILDNPLDHVEYDSIEEFVAAIDALPNPEVVTATGADEDVRKLLEEMKMAFNQVFDKFEQYDKKLRRMEDSVAELRRDVSTLDLQMRAFSMAKDRQG